MTTSTPLSSRVACRPNPGFEATAFAVHPTPTRADGLPHKLSKQPKFGPFPPRHVGLCGFPSGRDPCRRTSLPIPRPTKPASAARYSFANLLPCAPNLYQISLPRLGGNSLAVKEPANEKVSTADASTRLHSATADYKPVRLPFGQLAMPKHSY